MKIYESVSLEDISIEKWIATKVDFIARSQKVQKPHCGVGFCCRPREPLTLSINIQKSIITMLLHAIKPTAADQ